MSSDAGLSFPRSHAVGRNTCLGVTSHSLPEHRATFPILAE